MNATCHEVVINTLAEHLGVDPIAIEGRQLLEDDWGLDALDLTLLACRLEDALDIEIGAGALERLRTVADVEALARQAPAPLADGLGLGAAVTSSLREQVRRTPARTRRKWAHRQLRRTHRRDAA